MLVELLYRAQGYTNTNNFIGLTKYEYNLRINENLSRTGPVSMYESLSKTPPGPVGINENLSRTPLGPVSMNENLSRTPPGPVIINKNLCNPPLSSTKQHNN